MTSFCENGATQKSARQKPAPLTRGLGHAAVGGWPVGYRCVSSILHSEEQKRPRRCQVSPGQNCCLGELLL